MKTLGTGRPFGKEQFNTLVQSGTKSQTSTNKKAEVIVNGIGTDMSKIEALMQRAKKKTITQKVVLSLIDVAKKKEDFDKIQSYWNTYHCQSKIVSSGNRLYGDYCKNRICTLCCGIRKADTINRYYPIIKTWAEPYFVTLTAKSVYAKSLKKRIYDMLRGFKIISNRSKKRHQRGKGIKLMGIKSLECNFNPIARTYNPHFHLIVASKEIADYLVKEWCNLLTFEFARPYAQNIRKIDNLEIALVETIKYGSKIFTNPEKSAKSNLNISPQIYTSALDNILEAMKRNRIFDRFGFNLPKVENAKAKSSKKLNQYSEWFFDNDAANWVNVLSGEFISGYELPSELKRLLTYNINSDIQ